METTNSRIFPYLVGLSALLVAGSAAFYSVFGLSKLFSGATFAVIIMAGSLEFAKLVSASFLYRYWTKVNGWLKYYMTIGVVILVLITSAGIFGFLSNAYQGATVAFEKEMAITHRDFVRLLARAVGHKHFELVGGKILITEDGRKMEVTLSEESERRIALVALPVTFVRFAFTGYDDTASEMKRIDLHFQRGGG